MAKPTRIDITNIRTGSYYTGEILVGARRKPMHVILDTGSGALALDGHKYNPGTGDQSTNLAQVDSYGDGNSWTGAVFRSQVTIGSGDAAVTLTDANLAVAYSKPNDVFHGADGILGLAYAGLDDAFEMEKDTWAHKYPAAQVRTGKRQDLDPLLTQFQQHGLASDIIAFSTHRCFTRAGSNPAADQLNRGCMIVGGGVDAIDLYQGPFQDVKVLSDEWYCTNLKSIIVGTATPVEARRQGPQGMPSNSVIDSGATCLYLDEHLFNALILKFSADQQGLLIQSAGGDLVSTDQLDGKNWPALTVILEGATGDVALRIPPETYWQRDTEHAGAARLAINHGQDGLAVLGLPLLNGYFTIFDGLAAGGRGVVRFADKA